MRGLRVSLVAVSLVGLPVVMFGQAQATASVSNTMPENNFGFNLPSKLGTLTYSLNASEQVETGYSGGGAYAGTSFGGNLAYLSKSENNPFSLVYSGGLTFGDLPGNTNVQVYQNIAASQVFRTKSWVFVASDSFSFLPDSPTSGLSGVAGVGDVGIPPVQTGIGPGQTILTENATRYSNGLNGSATWQTTASLDFAGSAYWQVLKFSGDNAGGFNNNDSIGATFGPNYRIDARNSIGASANYNRSTYPDFPSYLIESYGATVNYNRAWSRRFSTTIGLGPTITHGNTIAPLPARVDIAGSATATYATRTTGFTASYDRAINAGSGVLLGALTDNATLSMNRPINRDWIFGASVGYSHNAELVPANVVAPTYNSIYAAAQVSRRLTNTLSMYGSYTAIWQSEHNAQAQQRKVGNGLNNVFSIGITFAPAPLLSGR